MDSLRNAIATTAVSLIVLLIFLGILEVVLRSTQLFGATVTSAQPDPVIRWRFIPGSTVWDFKENDKPVSGKINSHGWRDVERTVDKPDGVYRIAVLGDSFVEARQVEIDTNFLRLAEAQLNAAHGEQEFELLNFGLSGMTQTEQLIVLENDVPAFDPDMVVLFFYPMNDVSDVSPRSAGSKSRPYFEVGADGSLVLDTSYAQTDTYRWRSRLDPFRRHSALINLVIQRASALSEGYAIERQREGDEASEAGDAGPSLSSIYRLATDSPPSLMKANYALNKRLIQEIVGRANDANMEFLLVSISLAYQSERVQEYREIDPSFDPRYFANDLARFSGESGFHYMSLQEPFERHYEVNGRTLNWGQFKQGHWNYEGHELVAELLTSKIESMLD